MNRRIFLLTTSGLVMAGPVRADDRTFYTPGLAETAMQAGEVIRSVVSYS